MEETHYHAKRMRPLGKRRVAALAAVLVLLLGIAAAGVRYFDFVSRTVYEESTAHLAEVLHQSNNMLNEVVEKNLTYLHLWETTMRHISDEDEIRQLIEAVQQETGFSDFYFLSADGNYMTAAGETGYLGIQDDLEDRITQGGDIVMTAVLPGKPEMLVFACPENQGTYRGFAYDAVAVSYYNDDIVKVLDISAFDGTASRYVLHPDGRIIINCAAQMEEDVYNLLAAMQERSPLTSEDIQTLSDDFSQGRSGSRLVTLDGTRYYMTYQSAHILDWTIVGLVPAAVVNAGMNALQSSTIVMVSMIVLGISALALALVHRKSSVKLRRKDMEILYRDELFMKLSMNVDDVFLMLDAQTNRADYVSPNAEKLLGITAEQIQDPWWLKVPVPMMPFIEFFGIFTKPFALMIRLFANMLAGHMAMLVLTCLIFISASMGPALNGTLTVASVLFNIFMNALELLVAFIQAYVFTMLSAVFIGLAQEEHKEVKVKENNN